VRNNPISKIDPDGNTDFDVVTKTTRNPTTGAITKTVDVNVTYNIVDLSSKGVNNVYQVAGSGDKSSTFSSVLDVSKGEAGAADNMTVIVNVNIKYQLATDINKVDDAQNVLFVVDDVGKESGDKLEPVGRGTISGSVAAVENDYMGNKNIVNHEEGHNFGLEHVEGSGTNLMNPLVSTNTLTTSQRKQLFAVFGGIKDGQMHFGARATRKDAKAFVKDKNLTYDSDKAKKAGF
jgi:hypothetical protein